MRQKNIFLTCILAVFMLAQPVWQIAGISVKTWLVWLAAAAGGILLLYGKRGTAAKRTVLTNLLAVALIGNILQILWGAVTMSGCEESSLLTVALLMLFYLIYTQVEYKRVYVWPVLLCAAILYGGLLWNFLADPSYTFGLRPLLENREVLVSLLLLVCVAAAETYCREEEQTKRIFCLILAVLGYFLLFAVKDVIGMALLGISFPASALAHRPEKKYIQRNMRLTFLYFFMLSNMSLLTNYTSLLKTEVSYSLEDSIYLDLAIATAGSVFFAWWDRLPGAGSKVYERFRQTMGWILAGCGIAFVLLLLPGGHVAEADLHGSAAGISHISEELRQAAQRQGGVFYDSAYRYGIAGAGWLVCVTVTAGNRIRQLQRQGNIEPEAAMLFLIFLLQSVFYSPQPVTTPIYLLFAAMALHGGAEQTSTTTYGGAEKTVAAVSQDREEKIAAAASQGRTRRDQKESGRKGKKET